MAVKTIKKLLILILSVACAACLWLAAACTEKVNYFKLTCVETDHLEYNFLSDGEGKPAVQAGAEVKEGYVVRFTLIFGGKVDGEVVIKANSNVLTADESGIYSFAMAEDTVLSATNATGGEVVIIPSYEITFSKSVDDSGNEGRVHFYDVAGSEIESVTVDKFEDFSFTVEVSVYYKDTYSVLVNTNEVEPDEFGVYTVKNVMGKTSVTVYNLETDDPFVNRTDGGAGTRSNPFKISRPIDLYMLADLVNDDFHSGLYGGLYYEMTNDIDLGGEQLYIIGDMTTQGAYFYGDFNGNGYTISNYYIQDSIIDQANFIDIPLPYIGVFGLAAYGQDRFAVGQNRSAEIYNVKLKNFTINVDISDEEDFECYIGGLVGYGIGANIAACEVSGEIYVSVGSCYACAGGIVGIQQSFDGYYSGVRSCSSAVNIEAERSGSNGYVTYAGGITGMIAAYDSLSPAYIINSYSTGDIRNSLLAGGIVGNMSTGTSVSACYSTGRAVGINFGGGIAGAADYACIISDCYAGGIPSAGYARDMIVPAYAETGDPYIESDGTVILNCRSIEGGDSPSRNLFENILHWDESDWVFSATYPVIYFEPSDKNFNITINYGSNTVDGENTSTVAVKNSYIPIVQWNIISESIPEFITADNGSRSFGYYFDDKFTQKVPCSYVPTRNITLYAGFADYSEVTGVYYLVEGDGAYLELCSNGELVYRDGAINYTSYYTYNGSEVTLYDTVLALFFSDGDSYFSHKGTIEDGVLKIYDYDFFEESEPLNAVKKIDGFVYGEYFTADGTGYLFAPDGICTVSGTDKFSYTVDGNTVTIHGESDITATIEHGAVVTVNGESVSTLDAFAGVWEKSATSHREFTFDGKGGWKYEYFGYNSQGEKQIIEVASGEYNINTASGLATLSYDSGGFAGYAQFDGTFLAITYGNHIETYYKQFSFTGVWRFFNSAQNEPVQLELGGIGLEGYGNAVITYANNSSYSVTYETVEIEGKIYLVVFDSEMQVAFLEYNSGIGTLSGAVFSLFLNDYREDAVFCLYDDFEGEWVSNHDVLSLVQFNGLGSYNLKSTSAHVAVRGIIWIEGVQAGTYVLEDSCMKGTFTYRGVEYSIEYSEEDGKIYVTYLEDSTLKQVVLEERDDWYGNDLIDENGAVYSFDGRGNLEEGGKMTVTLTGGEKEEYTYKINGNVLEISGEGSVSGTIEAQNDFFLFSIGNSKLNYLNDFGGKWIMGGVDAFALNNDNSFSRNTLEIGKINPALKAEGSFLGKSVEFDYLKEEKLLTFEYNSMVYFISAEGGELFICYDKTFADTILCIREGTEDEFAGVYMATDGTTLLFDGLGGGAYNGTVLLLNSDFEVEEIYSYSFNERGLLVMMSSENLRYAFVENVKGTYSDGNGKNYNIQRTVLYEVHAEDSGEDSELTYTFDGVGKLYCSNGTVYDYNPDTIENDELEQVYTIYLSLNGAQFIAKLDYSTYTVDETDFTIYYVLTIVVGSDETVD